MIENFESFFESFKITDGTLKISELYEIIALDEGFEYFLNLDGEVSPVDRDEFLQYSIANTSMSVDTNKRFDIEMNGNEVVGTLSADDTSFDIVDAVEVETNFVGSNNGMLL